MADRNPEERNVGGSSVTLAWPPAGVSRDDGDFLDALWGQLQASGSLSPGDIQNAAEEGLRALPGRVQGDAAAYTRALSSLAASYPAIEGKFRRYQEHADFSSNHLFGEQHFLWLSPEPRPIRWRLYLTPAPATAPELLGALRGRLSDQMVPKVGMKLSTHDALCSYRDGLVLYAQDNAALQAILIAVRDEARDHRERFSGPIVRFTRPQVQVAGLAPEPSDLVTDLHKNHVASWFNSNKAWLDSWKYQWQEHVPIPSYTQFVATVLTTCYLLAESQQPQGMMRNRRGQASQGEAYATERKHSLFQGNVDKAFKNLGINPDAYGSGVGTPTATEEGVGWLRFWLFR